MIAGPAKPIKYPYKVTKEEMAASKSSYSHAIMHYHNGYPNDKIRKRDVLTDYRYHDWFNTGKALNKALEKFHVDALFKIFGGSMQLVKTKEDMKRLAGQLMKLCSKYLYDADKIADAVIRKMRS